MTAVFMMSPRWLSRPLGRAFLCGLYGVCGADEGEVAKGLREVADLPRAPDVIFLGEEAEVIGQPEEPFEHVARLIGPAVEGQCADKPERTGKELAFPAGQAIVGVVCRVAPHEAVTSKLARDRVDRSRHPLVFAGQEAHERDR